MNKPIKYTETIPDMIASQFVDLARSEYIAEQELVRECLHQAIDAALWYAQFGGVKKSYIGVVEWQNWSDDYQWLKEPWDDDAEAQPYTAQWCFESISGKPKDLRNKIIGIIDGILGGMYEYKRKYKHSRFQRLAEKERKAAEAKCGTRCE